MDPSKKVPLCPKKTRQNDQRDEMIDEKSFSCPFFRHFFCFNGIFCFFVLGQHDSTCWNCWNSLTAKIRPEIFTTFFCWVFFLLQLVFFGFTVPPFKKNGNPRNYRRLLGDLHWPYDTDFVDYSKSWWKGFGLICLRTGVFVFFGAGIIFHRSPVFFWGSNLFIVFLFRFIVQIHDLSS